MRALVPGEPGGEIAPPTAGTRPGRSAARSLGLLAPLVLGVAGCLLAGWFELTRALAGREIAWVYVVEWPLYAVIGSYMWWRLRDSAGGRPAANRRSPTAAPAADDPELLAWQHYLAALQAHDPPGAPPAR